MTYNPYFYNASIKNVLVAFMNIFDGLILHKTDSLGNFVQNVTIPVAYGPVTKAQQFDATGPHVFSETNTELGKRYYTQLPRIGITLDGLSFDENRATGLTEQRFFYGQQLQEDGINIDDVFQDTQPLPWNLTITAHFRNNSLDYLTQFLEQYLILYSPKYFLRVKEFSFLNIERDIAVELNSVVPSFSDDMTSTDDRKVDCTLSHTISAFLYKPLSRASIIKCIKSKYFIGDIPELDVAYSTSGAQLTSAGIPTPTSAVPSSSDFFTSGSYIDTSKSFDWFSQVTSAGV